ncbi:MAG: nucleoside triphosphate pyrophosphohydrolase [Gammaproteobacteria bacterium]
MEKSAQAVTDLLHLMTTLREGCPWDRRQTMRSLRGHSLDEIYELLEAIDNNDLTAVREELGDILFHIAFYAQIASEQGQFDFADVATAVVEKLQRRHPHVFADAKFSNRQQLAQSWETTKQAERLAKKGGASLLDDVAVTLPETLRAAKLQKRAAAVGFDWAEAAAVVAKVREELQELEQALAERQQDDIEQEMGDVLFSCVNLSRHLRTDPELALRAANRKFERRFRYIEDRLAEQNKTLTEVGQDEMERLWEQAKQAEQQG